MPQIAKASHESTNKIILSIIKSKLDVGPMKILDMGCGSGHTLKAIAEFYIEKGWDPSLYLLGVDIDLSSYAADPIPSQKIDLNNPLDLKHGPYDLILAVEVLEHSRRVYQLMEDVRKLLKPNGTFIFSVPNPMNMNSRLKYFLYGHYHMFFGPSSEKSDAGRLCGHINALPIQMWDYGLRYAGFNSIKYLDDRLKKGAIFWTALFSPFLILGKLLMHREQRKYDKTIYDQNRRPLSEINSLKNLASRSMIFVCS